MEQKVSIKIVIKNVDETNEYKVELISYQDSDRRFSKSAGFTENKAKNLVDNTITFEKFFAILVSMLKIYLDYLYFLILN